MALPSPCIDICVFDKPSGLCTGCLRTLDEVRGWKKMTHSKRHQIINDRARRKNKLANQGTTP